MKEEDIIKSMVSFKEKEILSILQSDRFNRRIYVLKTEGLTGKNTLEQLASIKRFLASKNTWFVTEEEIMDMLNYPDDDEKITKKMEDLLSSYR